jgi:endogenous inhibitor of DNA gyrase (YacG/DUF329 family)
MSCPICGKAMVQDYRPFCSRRCADIDLGRWLTESYRIAADDVEDIETEPDDPRPPPSHQGRFRSGQACRAWL